MCGGNAPLASAAAALSQGVPTIRILILLVVLVVSPQLVFAGTSREAHAQYMRTIERMMVALAPQNARASTAVREEYRAYLDQLVLDEFEALEDALYTGGLVPLPANHEAFNLKVRTDGPAPIAEKDLANQTSYIAARPAAIGALLDVASRVKSGPLEITSLVRHSEYQDALRATNANANTSIPMHTMGLAFDIALINSPLTTVRETRDVLQQMQAAGDILFIAERKQLVFHVVPHPSRLGYYTDVYARALQGILPRSGDLPSSTALMEAQLTRAVVNTEIVAIRPTDEHAAEWWAAEGAHTDLSMAVTPLATPHIGGERRGFLSRFASRVAALVTGVVHSARQLVV
jgi:hypothetical protein